MHTIELTTAELKALTAILTDYSRLMLRVKLEATPTEQSMMRKIYDPRIAVGIAEYKAERQAQEISQ